MKPNHTIKFLALFVLMQSICNSTIYAVPTEQSAYLNKYIQKAHTKEQQKAQLKKWLPLKNIAALSALGFGAYSFYNDVWKSARIDVPADDMSALNLALLIPLMMPFIAYGDPTLFFKLFGKSVIMPSIVGIKAAYENYKYYSIKAPAGFKESLVELDALIDKDKSVVMGDKDYLLSKDFNNTANTGYAEINLKTCDMAKSEKEEFPLSAKKQREIYIMPDDKNLVTAFKAITETLKNSVDNSAVAFIAIRPTPIPTNSAKQIVPRIVIVLKDIGSEIAISHAPTYNKQAADHILGIVYEALETIPDIKASGYWPRYSDKVIFGTIVGKQFMPKLDIPLVFIGQGNTDFKMANPKEFERKKLLGITRNGDMTYPLNTPESEKIRREIVRESAKR